MKKIILIIYVIQTFQIVNAQWIQQNSGTNQNLYDIEFINEKTGWAVGDAGVVIKTTNGGTNWLNVPNPSGQYGGLLWSVCPVDSEVVYVVAGYDFIMKTSNGGSNWNVLKTCLTCNSAIVGLHFMNRDTGWFLGTYKVLRTYDGGNTLDSFYAPWFTNYDIYFKDINTGIFCGDGRVFKSTDSGMNWYNTSVPVGGFPMFRKLGVSNNTNVWVSGLDAIIYRSTDFCESWNAIDTLQQGVGIIALDFINKDTGFIAGGANKIFKTTNSGYSWITQTPGVNMAFVGSIKMINNDTGWYCGGIGNIFKTTNSGVPTFISSYVRFENLDFLLYQNYPNPFNNRTNIEFNIFEKSYYKLEIFDMIGQRVSEIFNTELDAGKYTINYESNLLSSGIYIYKISSEKHFISKKFILIK